MGHLGPTRDILGHEGVGRIEELGSNVSSLDPSVMVGQRVGVAWVRDACGRCNFCIHSDGEVRCEQLSHSGRKWDGTFAEYTLVPLRYLTRIPEYLDVVPDELVAPILCAGVTAYRAIKECRLVPGSWIGISGAGGGVGALGIQYAKAMGYRVIAVDTGVEKGEFCKALGAEHYIDIMVAKTLGDAVKSITGGRGCAGVIVTAGVNMAYQSAFEMLAPFGTYVCVGIPPPDQKMQLHPLLLIDSGAKMIGSVIGTRVDTIEAIEFVQRGLVIPKVEWAKLEDIEKLMTNVAQGKVSFFSLLYS